MRPALDVGCREGGSEGRERVERAAGGEADAKVRRKEGGVS